MAKKEGNKEKKKSNFMKELRSELKKVTWPTLKKLVNNTSAVISIVLIVSIIVFILDVCFESLNDFGVEKLKTLVSNNTQESDVVEETTDLGDGIELVSDDKNQDIEQNQTSEMNDNTTDNESNTDSTQ